MCIHAPDQLARELHDTNRRVGFWLNSLFPPSESSHSAARIATPEQMSGLLSELLRAGEWLRALPEETNAELAHELSEYRKQVERLRALLPFIHSALLGERARLEQERERVKVASEWARLSRQTL